MTDWLSFRQAEFEDLPALLSLYDDMFDKPDSPLPEKEIVGHTWKKLMENPIMHVFVGEHRQTRGILASATLAILPNLTRSCRPYGVIENVVTRKEHRRRGIAAALLSELLRFAWNHDCYKVMLLSSAGRTDAHRLYERLGFSRDAKVGFVAKPSKID